MNELQQTLYILLKEVDQICKKHQIEYYLAGGSVIGALRHRGFIPWDDDIDVVMTRENWQKFEAVIDDELPPNRELITAQRCPSHTKITIKYMNKETTTFFLSQVLDDTGCGLSLDIMSLEPLPIQNSEQRIAEFLVYNELLTPFFLVNERIRDYLPLYYKYKWLCSLVGKKKIMDMLYQRIFCEEVTEYTQYIYRWGEQLLIYDKDIFQTPQYVPFEDMMAPIPQKAFEYLRNTYGDDWYIIPQKAEQETHTTIRNLHLSYNNVVNDYRRFLNKKALWNDFEERKNLWMKRIRYAPSKRKENVVSLLIVKGIVFSKRFQRIHNMIKELYEWGEYDQINHIFSEYVNEQLKKQYITNGLFVKIDDEDLAYCIMALCMSGNYYIAQKIQNVRLQIQPPTGILEEAFELVEVCRRLVAAIHAKDDEIILNCIKNYSQYTDICVDFIHARIYLYSSGRGDRNELSALQKSCENMVLKYPENGDLLKDLGDLYLFQKNYHQAKLQYKNAQTLTRNGLILMDIQDKIQKIENKERFLSEEL